MRIIEERIESSINGIIGLGIKTKFRLKPNAGAKLIGKENECRVERTGIKRCYKNVA